MSSYRRVLIITAGLLLTVTVYALLFNNTAVDFGESDETLDVKIVDFRTASMIIETDKEEYALGDSVYATIYIVNPTSEEVAIKPIISYTIDANSKYEPNKIRRGVFKSYPPDSLINIPANGKTQLDKETLKPTYPGPFTIECLGVKKTVNVTGARWEKLNEDKLILVIEPVIYNEVYIGYILELDVLIVNECPYDVKLGHPAQASIWEEPIGNQTTIYWDLIDTVITIPANSSYKLTSIDPGKLTDKTIYFKIGDSTAFYRLYREG